MTQTERHPFLLLLTLALVLAAACGQPGLPSLPGAAPAAPADTPTPEPPAPTATPVPATPDQAASDFFQAWQGQQYSQMYDLLGTAAQARTSRDAFVSRYTKIESGIGQLKLAVQAQPANTDADGATAGVPFTVKRNLAIFGDVSEQNTLPLVHEGDQWRVDWTAGLIFHDLTDSTPVRVSEDDPKRGRILDRNGTPLADDGSVLAVGVVPGQITDEAAMLKALSDALGMDQATIKQKYQDGQPDWFMPITIRSESEKDKLQQALGNLPGVTLQDQPARVYPLGPAAAHITGYLSHPTADDLRQLASAGYSDADWIGKTGVEGWAEKDLAGQKGGKITITTPGGVLVRTIVQKAAVPGSDVTLSIDARIQQQAYTTLGDKTGSVVAVDPRDNALLALVSQPSFDPNQFILGLTDAQWQALNGDTHPLDFRATEATYPTGSTFKIITMTAGMEKGGFKTSDTFDCGLDWNGLPGVTLHNWQAEGTLNLVDALTQSCNPAFYTIGLKLDHIDPNILPDYARQFGLGKPTGIVGVPEADGVVPDPAWKQQTQHEPWTSGDSVNLAIGQGYLLVSPIQLANAYSAFADNGSLRTPILVTSIDHPDGSQQTFTAQEQGTLPMSATTRAAILQGMDKVTSTPEGTAYYAFRDEKTAIAAKTGSAENENPDAHAWFAGYMTPQKPTLLVIVMIEGGQHGGTVAAPLARQVLDAAYPLNH